MNFSRPLYLTALFVLSVSLTAGVTLAQNSVSAPAQPEPLDGKVVEDIVARVNDQIITQSDYQRAQQQMEAEAKSSTETEDSEKDLLRDLIDQQLLLSKGKELGITGETELVRRLDEIRKKNHLDSLEDLQKAAEAQGVSYEDFKQNIQNGIITQQVVRDEVSRRVSMSDADVRSYFKQHESEFAQPESVHLSEILIPTPNGAGTGAPDASQVSAAQAKADEVETKLRGGASFQDLAKSESTGPTAAVGGDLGDFTRGSGKLAPVFEEKTFSLQSGQFTEPIRTKQGFVILEVTKHNPGGEASFQSVEPQVQEALFMERMQPALREYLTKLREEAYIEIKPGYVDSGASQNEIHPSYSAYVPPGPKKKKKFQRTRFRGTERGASKKQVVVAKPSGAAGSTPQVASTQSEPGIQKPGKKEKIRFGQAPRESLPPAQNQPAAPAENTQVATNGGGSVNDIEPAAPAPAKVGKTRYSQRPIVHKTKKEKAAAAEADKPPAPSPEEAATQKVQNQPLGLAGPQQKKKKQKGEKTRYSAKPKQPEQAPQQPYMGNQPQPAASQSQGAGAPSKSGDSGAKPGDSQAAPQNP